MRAALLHETGQDELEVVDDIEPAGFGPGKVRVRMRATGLCHSDLSAMSGVLPQPAPFVPGHEGAGEVLETGEGVTHVAAGDRVLVCWLPPCGACPSCRRGQGHLCLTGFMNAGTPNFRRAQGGSDVFGFAGTGTFAEEAVLPAACATPIPDDVPYEIAALIGCGVTTGLGAAFNTARVEAGSSVAVIGCGGVGDAAIAAASLAGARKVIAVDIDDAKLDTATQFGATHCVNSRGTDPVAEVRRLTGGNGADLVIEAVGRPETYQQGFAMRDLAGTLVLAGVPSPDVTVELPLLEVFSRGGALKSSWYGDCLPSRDFPLLIDLYLSGKLDLGAFVTETIALDEVETAFERMLRGKVLRSVVVL